MALFRALIYLLSAVAGIYAIILLAVYVGQRSMLYFPTHDTAASKLSLWIENQNEMGYAFEVPYPKAVWLMMHGNGGQATHRDYVLRHMSPDESLYVLEYPGYGLRSGSPTRDSMNQAAVDGYRALRIRFPNLPVNVLGESIGSGPACALASERIPPDKIVLAVPFDILANVAAEHMPYAPTRLLLKDCWNNIEALKSYKRPVEIYGARFDTIIPVAHAEALARSVPQSHLILLDGGHNDWSSSDLVQIK